MSYGRGQRARHARHRGVGQPREAGTPAGDVVTTMSELAITIAVSEIAGVPLADLCGFVIVTWAHLPGGRHALGITPGTPTWEAARQLLAEAEADLAANPDDGPTIVRAEP